jgi:hypothetical protein
MVLMRFRTFDSFSRFWFLRHDNTGTEQAINNGWYTLLDGT